MRGSGSGFGCDGLGLVKVLWIYLFAFRGQCVWDPNTKELWETELKVKAKGQAWLCVRLLCCVCVRVCNEGVMKRCGWGGLSTDHQACDRRC